MNILGWVVIAFAKEHVHCLTGRSLTPTRECRLTKIPDNLEDKAACMNGGVSS